MKLCAKCVSSDQFIKIVTNPSVLSEGLCDKCKSFTAVADMEKLNASVRSQS